MARAVTRRQRIRRQDNKQKKSQLPLTIHNYIIFVTGIMVLVLGYISLSIGPVDSFWSLTVAPILLVTGYLIIIPLSFLYQSKSKKQPPHEPGKSANE